MNKKSKTIFDKSNKGKVRITLPYSDIPDVELENFIDVNLLRTVPANMPQLSEPEIVRHYVNLSVKNHHVDKDFYPLGSCTMKYNPKINDKIASNPNFTNIHPDQPLEDSQRILKLMYE